MKNRLLAFALLAGILFPPVASAAGDAHVEASMTFHGATVKLDHVLIVRYGNEEEDSDGPELRIFLSDRDIPLSVAGLADPSSASDYVRQGHFSGVMITADPTGHQLKGGVQLLDAPGMAEAGIATVSTNIAYSRLQVSGARASGAAALDGDTDDGVKLTATFDAPIAINPVTADLKGAAAQASAPALAMAACSGAMHSGDAAAMAKYNTAARNKGIADMRAQASEQDLREAMAGVPTAAAVAKSVKRVVVRGQTATVLLTGGNIGHMVREADSWKCD